MLTLFLESYTEAFEDTYLQYGASAIQGSRDPYHAETQRYNDRFISKSIRRHNNNQDRQYQKYRNRPGLSRRQYEGQRGNEINLGAKQHNRNHGNYGARGRRNVVHPGNMNLVDLFSHLLQRLPISQNMTYLCPLMGKPYITITFSNNKRKNMGSIVSVHLQISMSGVIRFFMKISQRLELQLSISTSSKFFTISVI